jgi:hypothetical protein
LIAILGLVSERILIYGVLSDFKEDIMKKSLSIVSIFVVIVGLALYVGATAGDSQDQAIPGSRQPRMLAKNGPGQLARYVRENMAAEAIAGITKQPVDTIRKELQEKRLPAVLQEYQIDRKAFGDAMHAKFQDLLGKLVDGNYLTVDQRNQIVARMDQYAQRRELMKSVIDKAVTDGTITPDQAQTLLKRPR